MPVNGGSLGTASEAAGRIGSTVRICDVPADIDRIKAHQGRVVLRRAAGGGKAIGRREETSWNSAIELAEASTVSFSIRWFSATDRSFESRVCAIDHHVTPIVSKPTGRSRSQSALPFKA